MYATAGGKEIREIKEWGGAIARSAPPEQPSLYSVAALPDDEVSFIAEQMAAVSGRILSVNAFEFESCCREKCTSSAAAGFSPDP